MFPSYYEKVELKLVHVKSHFDLKLILSDSWNIVQCSVLQYPVSWSKIFD